MKPHLEDLLKRIHECQPEEVELAAFAFASSLLLDYQLMAGGHRFRVAEIELYFFSNSHPDPFVHCDKNQQLWGSWYLHRSGGSLKNGTFKGIDFTFGDGEAYAAFLIRSLVSPDGEIVDGSCLCVESLMSYLGKDTVSDLDKSLIGHTIFSGNGPLYFEKGNSLRDSKQVYFSPRVGLTLKGKQENQTAIDYLPKPYRFLTEPRRIKKGRSQLLFALVDQGLDSEEIQRITGSPRRTINKYIAEKNLETESKYGLPPNGIIKPIDFWKLASR